MTATPTDVPGPVTRRFARTVVVVDVVEYVRLIEQDEEGTARRWREFAHEVLTRLLPRFRISFQRSTGDGLILEFEAVQPAIQCAIAMQDLIATGNRGLERTQMMSLRIGAHVGDVIDDGYDIQGKAINLAQRLTTLAGPGEIVVSADLRDQLMPGLDAEVEDLGDCFVKHLPRPVRAYRVAAAGRRPQVERVLEPSTDARPVVAVIPFAPYAGSSADRALGEAFADDVISALSRTADMHVISRLSTTGLTTRQLPLSELGPLLGAGYVLSGSYAVGGRRLRLHLELAETKGQRTVWTESLTGLVDELLEPDGDLLSGVVSGVASAIVSNEIERARTRSMPTLESHTLLLGAISFMHRSSADDFERARAMLEHLSERNPREPAPRAWMGKWHVMRTVQGLSQDRAGDARRAQACVSRALDAAPEHSLALAIDGLVAALLMRDLDRAQASYSAALQANPNESLAWLYSSALHFYRGEGDAAVNAANHALRLSPLDPMRYYYDTFAATAMLAANRYPQAIELAQRSLKGNRMHTATYRTLAIAQVLSGDVDAARITLARMMALEPGLTASAYLDRFPGRDRAMAVTYAQALREAGLPD